METPPIAVIGASGRMGQALCRALGEAGLAFRPVVRDAARWPGAEPAAVAELEDGPGLRAALAGVSQVVTCVHARFAPAVLAAAPPGVPAVLMGSTRRFSAIPDPFGDWVREAEALLLGGPRPGVMLHATMVYGARGEDNVQRLAALMRRLPVAPLPGGGRALVQPIHQGDVIRCLLAALRRDWPAPRALVIAGPQPLPYRDFLRAVCRAAGFRPPPVVPLPVGPLLAAARLARLVPGLPRIGPDEIRRLTEDKAFPIAAMREELGVEPIGLEQGLALTFARP